MSKKPRFNFENSTIGDGNVFGDNSSSNVQVVGREELAAQLLKVRSATVAERVFDEPTRQQLLQHVQEAEDEAKEAQPNPKVIDKCLGAAKAVATGALTKAAADMAVIPLIQAAVDMAHRLLS